MRNYLSRYIAIATFSLCTLTACEIESHDSGKIDGFWHLEYIDTLETGGTLDVSNEKLFWSLQVKLLEVSNKSSGSKYIFSFRQADGSLYLSDPLVSDRREGDPVVKDASVLAPYGINNLEETFAVEALDGSKMILRSETLRLKLKKF
ncbi:MAG: lipocalin-like domain-containing protein [Prevotella sp.]